MGKIRLRAPSPLTALHRKAIFDCGHGSLNRWLIQRALTDQIAGRARTYVVCAGRHVVGFYAISVGSAYVNELTNARAPGRTAGIPLALLIGPAVDFSQQGKGLGAGLLKDAMLRVERAAATLGIRGIMVDALNQGSATFYGGFGFTAAPGLPFKMIVTMNQIALLPAHTRMVSV